jgi:hypothetical protein
MLPDQTRTVERIAPLQSGAAQIEPLSSLEAVGSPEQPLARIYERG